MDYGLRGKSAKPVEFKSRFFSGDGFRSFFFVNQSYQCTSIKHIVTNGTGGGNYPEGETVTLIANANVVSAIQGTQITLTATPHSGNRFVQWQGNAIEHNRNRSLCHPVRAFAKGIVYRKGVIRQQKGGVKGAGEVIS